MNPGASSELANAGGQDYTGRPAVPPRGATAFPDVVMLRKFLYLLLALTVLYALAAMKKGRPRPGAPVLKSIGRTLRLVAWILLAVYLAYFIYWVYSQVR